MSERKTDEIKFRVEPSVKARWQAAADRQGIALSEMGRRGFESEANPIVDIATLEPDLSQFQTLLGAAADFHKQSVAKIEDPDAPLVDRLAERLQEAQAVVVKREWKPFGADQVD